MFCFLLLFVDCHSYACCDSMCKRCSPLTFWLCVKTSQCALPYGFKAATGGCPLSGFHIKLSKEAVVIILVIIIAIAGIFTLMLYGKNNLDSSGKKAGANSEVSGNDLISYESDLMEQNYVIESDASISPDAFSEEEAVSFLKLRKLFGSFIMASYDMNGNFTEVKPIAADSDEKHPYYETFYYTPEGAVWDILIIDGCIFATNEDGLVVSESESVTFYDNTNNKFYKAYLDLLDVDYRQVKRIDAYTLSRIKPDA